MAWTIKTKTIQQENDLYILTPDNQNILVGSAEDQDLIYKTAYNNWNKPSKNSIGDWNLKTKIEV